MDWDILFWGNSLFGAILGLLATMDNGLRPHRWSLDSNRRHIASRCEQWRLFRTCWTTWGEGAAGCPEAAHAHRRLHPHHWGQERHTLPTSEEASWYVVRPRLFTWWCLLIGKFSKQTMMQTVRCYEIIQIEMGQITNKCLFICVPSYMHVSCQRASSWIG